MAKRTKAAQRGDGRDADNGRLSHIEDANPMLRRIALDDIQDNAADNHRDAEGEGGSHELQGSLAIAGQMQPICVRRAGRMSTKWRVVFGFRRVAAARALGWTSITAIAIEHDLTDEQAAAMRAIENVHRRELTPVEEAVAVQQLLRLEEGEWPPPAEKVDHAAGLIGKSPTWVRDRAYLARLSAKARALVASGRLPLGQAREIAKLADMELQTQCAEMAARNADGTRGWSLGDVRGWVNQHMRSLRVVPWRLDEPFAGKPACVSCPHNTMNNSTLFEHDGKNERPDEGEAGLCTQEHCFQAKHKACEKAIDKAVKQVAKKPGGVALTVKGLEAVTPAHVKPATLVRRVKKEVAPETVKTGEGPSAKKTAPKATSEEDAKRKHQDACSERERDLADAVFNKLQGDQTALGMARFIAAGSLDKHPSVAWSRNISWNTTQAKRDRAVADGRRRADYRETIDLFRRDSGVVAAPEMVELLRIAAKDLGDWVVNDGLTELDTAVLEDLAEAIGVEVPPAPKLEDFLPKPDAGAGQAATAKKTTRKKKAAVA